MALTDTLALALELAFSIDARQMTVVLLMVAVMT